MVAKDDERYHVNKVNMRTNKVTLVNISDKKSSLELPLDMWEINARYLKLPPLRGDIIFLKRGYSVTGDKNKIRSMRFGGNDDSEANKWRFGGINLQGVVKKVLFSGNYLLKGHDALGEYLIFAPGARISSTLKEEMKVAFKLIRGRSNGSCPWNLLAYDVRPV